MKAERVAEVRGGWRVVVDEGVGQTGQRRVTAMAWRTAVSAALGVPYRQTLRATKPTEGAALAELLAKALERNA